MEADNDVAIVLCPLDSPTPYDGSLWSCAVDPLGGSCTESGAASTHADGCVRAGLTDYSYNRAVGLDARFYSQVVTESGAHEPSATCMPSNTSISFTLTVNTTTATLTNDAGCPVAHHATSIGSRPAALYIATDDDKGYWTLISNFEVRDRRSRLIASDDFRDVSTSRRRWAWPEASMAGMALVPGLLRVRKGHPHTRLQIPGGALPSRFDLTVAVLPSPGDKYAVDLCEEASITSLTSFFGDEASQGADGVCATVRFDPSTEPEDNAIFTATQTTGDATCTDLPGAATLIISVNVDEVVIQRRRCAMEIGWKEVITHTARAKHGLQGSLVGGLLLEIGEHAGASGFGANLLHVRLEEVTGSKPSKADEIPDELKPGAITTSSSGTPSGIAIFSFILNLGCILAACVYCAARRGWIPGVAGRKLNRAIDVVQIQLRAAPSRRHRVNPQSPYLSSTMDIGLLGAQELATPPLQLVVPPPGGVDSPSNLLAGPEGSATNSQSQI